MATAVAPPDRQELPQVFGRYLLLKRLSRGGMGEIFLGRLGEIQGFEKPVIIKKVLPQLSADEQFVKRFIDEAQVAIKLNHANIAPVYEVGKVEGDYFLALEYVEGRDLRRLMARCAEEGCRMSADLCLYIARELVAGLGYAHRRTDESGQLLSLVHCDISPPNVMVSFEGEVKIIDFGIAKSALQIAGSNPNIGFGKFGYMAPEQLLKGGVVDRRTDVYAAGVVLYELLTGQRLFQFPEGADYRQMARIVTRGEWIKPSQRAPGLGVDPSLDELVSRALAARAADRYQTAEEFRDAISAKLSQMNPTISADAVAQVMRRLFAREIMDERALIASAGQVNVDDFRDQIVGSMSHTVTFARAAPPRRTTSATPLRPAILPARRRSPRALVLGTLALVGVGAAGVATFQLARPTGDRRPAATRGAHRPAMTVQPAPPPPQPAPSQPAQPLPAALPPTPPSHPSAIATAPAPPQARAPLDAPRNEPARKPKPRLASARPAPGPTAPAVTHAGSPPPEAAPPHRAGADDEQAAKALVQSKFRAVQSEYKAFRGEFGLRLESQWNDITHEMIFGKPGEKYARVNTMLDSLRRDMVRVRTGGTGG